MGILWNVEPEPGFVPPGNFREFLERYPKDIRKYAEIAAKHYKLDLPNDSFDDLVQDVITMFLSLEHDQDLVETYPRYLEFLPPGAETPKSLWFHDYIRGNTFMAIQVLMARAHGQPESSSDK